MDTPTEPRVTAVPVETKASMFRGYVAAIERAGILDDVRERVSERTRALIDRPPLVSTWLSHEPTDELLIAVDRLRGPLTVRRISRDAALNGLAPAVRLIIESVLRALGASPASLFSRLPQITSSTARGSEWSWEAKTPSSGTITVRFPARRDIPACVFESVGGSLESIFDLCRTDGKVAPAEVLPEKNAARFRVRWSTGN